MTPTRIHIKDRVGHPCCYCRRQMLPTSSRDSSDPKVRGQTVSEEHIRPRALGGTNDPDNLTGACQRCNSLRGHLDHDLFCMYARHVLVKHPDCPTVYLRGALVQFIASLAAIAVRNKRESKQAVSITVRDLEATLKKVGEI